MIDCPQMYAYRNSAGESPPHATELGFARQKSPPDAPMILPFNACLDQIQKFEFWMKIISDVY